MSRVYRNLALNNKQKPWMRKVTPHQLRDFLESLNFIQMEGFFPEDSEASSTDISQK